jgi:hypothetical protein
VLGGRIVLGSVLGGGPQGGGASGAGQVMGLLFGVLLLGAGIFYLVLGIRALSRPPEAKPRRKRQPRDDDEE